MKLLIRTTREPEWLYSRYITLWVDDKRWSSVFIRNDNTGNVFEYPDTILKRLE